MAEFREMGEDESGKTVADVEATAVASCGEWLKKSMVKKMQSGKV